MGIVRSIHRGGTVVQLAKVNPFKIAVNQLPQSPQDSLIDLAVERLLDRDQLSQFLDSSQTDSDDNSLDISLPEVPVDIEPVQLINQLLMLTKKCSTEIHPAPFAGTAAENVLEWLESFNEIATHNDWNGQKQLQLTAVFLKDTAEPNES